MVVLIIHYFQQRSHCYWTWKTFKKHEFLVLANVQQLLSTAWKTPRYSQFRAKFDADMLSFRSATFLVQQGHKWNTTQVHLIRHYSKVIRATVLSQAGNDTPVSTLIYIWQ